MKTLKHYFRNIIIDIKYFCNDLRDYVNLKAYMWLTIGAICAFSLLALLAHLADIK